MSHHERPMTWLDRYRVVQRFIATILGVTAVGVTIMFAWTMMEDGIEVAELVAMTSLLIAMITATTTTIGQLGKQEGK